MPALTATRTSPDSSAGGRALVAATDPGGRSSDEGPATPRSSCSHMQRLAAWPCLATSPGPRGRGDGGGGETQVRGAGSGPQCSRLPSLARQLWAEPRGFTTSFQPRKGSSPGSGQVTSSGLERPRGPVGQAGPATDLLWCSRTSFDVPPRGDQADEPIAEPRGRTFGKKPRCRVRWRSVHGHVADPSHPRSLIPPPGGSAPVFAWPVPLHPQVSGQPVGGRVSTNPSVGVCVATAEGGSGGDAPLQVSPGPALCLHTTGIR